MQAIITPVVVSGLGYEVIAKSRTQRFSIHHLILAVFHCFSESLTGVNYACEQMGTERLEPELPPEPISSTDVHLANVLVIKVSRQRWDTSL